MPFPGQKVCLGKLLNLGFNVSEKPPGAELSAHIQYNTFASPYGKGCRVLFTMGVILVSKSCWFVVSFSIGNPQSVACSLRTKEADTSSGVYPAEARISSM